MMKINDWFLMTVLHDAIGVRYTKLFTRHAKPVAACSPLSQEQFLGHAAGTGRFEYMLDSCWTLTSQRASSFSLGFAHPDRRWFLIQPTVQVSS